MTSGRIGSATLQRLSLNESRARSTLAQHGQALPIDIDGPWLASLAPLALGDAPAAAGSDDWSVRGDYAGAGFTLHLAAAHIRTLVESHLSGMEVSDLPDALVCAALEQAFSRILAAFGQGSVRVDAATPGRMAALRHRFVLSLAREGVTAEITGELTTDGVGLMLAAAACRAPARGGIDMACPIRLPLEVGRARLSPQEFASLRRHDVVMLEAVLWSPQDDGASSLWLSTGGAGGVTVAVRGPRIEVLNPWRTLDMSNSVPDDSGLPDAALDALPVSLRFDLGELVIDMAELRRMAVGQVFDLGLPPAAAIRVCANGATVGAGELVEIDGRIGVSLTHIGAQEASS